MRRLVGGRRGLIFRIGRGACSAVVRPLAGYQLVEPLDLTLAGLQAELVQLAGVPVVAGIAPDGCTQVFAAFLDLPAPPLEDPHAGLGGSAAEERQVHTETVVGVVLRAGV